ncbi:MAG TPA: DUF1579 family protein [Nevskia sp.]|jgi:hypothetical protein|nr:DUF1579 family protein [Nevskia sp.]
MTRQPLEQHLRLHAFVGDWTGEEQLAPSRWAAGGPATARVSARAQLGGFFVEQHYTEEVQGRVSLQARAVFAWDEESRQFLLYWFDSYGFAPQQPGTGQWRDDTLVLTRVSSRGMARHSYRFEGADLYHLRLENSFDGGHTWQPVADGVYRRA